MSHYTNLSNTHSQDRSHSEEWIRNAKDRCVIIVLIGTFLYEMFISKITSSSHIAISHLWSYKATSMRWLFARDLKKLRNKLFHSELIMLK